MLGIRSRKVAVTGACSTVGYQVCREVLGYSPRELIMIDRNPSKLNDLADVLSWAPGGGDIVPVSADVCDMSCVFEESKPQIIFHTSACNAPHSVQLEPVEAVRQNVFAVKAVVDLSVRHEAALFVHVVTNGKEDPHSVVAMAKRLAETYVHTLAQEKGLRAVVARLGPALSHPRNLHILRDAVHQLLRQVIGMSTGSRVTIALGAGDMTVDLHREPLPHIPSTKLGDVCSSPTWDIDEFIRCLAILRSIVDHGEEECLRLFLEEITTDD